MKNVWIKKNKEPLRWEYLCENGLYHDILSKTPKCVYIKVHQDVNFDDRFLMFGFLGMK